MSTDRAIVMRDIGSWSVEETDVDPPGPHEVLVRMDACGVCHSDLWALENGWQGGLPVVLGHEGAGVVEQVGPEVEGLEPGQRVTLGWRSPCGECAFCRRGDLRNCPRPPRAEQRLQLSDGTRPSQFLQLGALATRTVVHERAAVPLADGLPAEQACLIGCCVATGVGSVLHTAGVWPGAKVGVIGCGAVGISVIQGARLAGAGEIHAIDIDARKAEAARAFGATHTDAGEGLDFVFDVVSKPETMDQALKLAGYAGTVVMVGLPEPATTVPVGLMDLFVTRRRLAVSHGGDHVPAQDFPQLAAQVRDGSLDLAGMVIKVAGLDDFGTALDDMRAGNVIRTVISFSDPNPVASNA
jgi:S-(hydroxymethyl)mycothiol dehydrogenase